jgi:hypothetical protein
MNEFSITVHPPTGHKSAHVRIKCLEYQRHKLTLSYRHLECDLVTETITVYSLATNPNHTFVIAN